MQDADKIIEFLNRSGPTSGTQLGAELGVSRMAVQKRIQSLVDLGLPVRASPGVGYVLESGVDLLEANRIRKHFIPTINDLVDSVEVFQSIASTNSHLLSQPFSVGKVKACLAETQSSGRGRRGNAWMSAPYRNIMLSVSWGFDHWPTTITGLSLAVGLVVAEYLNEQHNAGVTIKWPNDILVGRDKLGGILVDVAGESTGACNVVIGLGLNVHQPDWSTESDYRWCDLKGLDVDIERNVLAADLVSVLAAMLSQFSKSGFEPLTERWNALSSFAGQNIRVGNADSAIVGKMHGVDELGALVIDTEEGLQKIADSSLSVRLLGA